MPLTSSKRAFATALLLAGLGISLAACAGNNVKVASLKDGACKAFDAPPHVILGKTRPDQNWIDGQVEAGVGACQWKRPKARPASLDAKPAVAALAPSAAAPVKKKSFWRRLLRTGP